jgi:enoyl-CoA hydratase/carnithine racemase
VVERSWDHNRRPEGQVAALCAAAWELGFLTVDFGCGGDGRGLSWSALEPWTRTRAVTVAVVDGTLASPALEVALCADLVYLRPQASLVLAHDAGAPAPGVIWALGRAGRPALARGLLDTAPVTAGEAAALGLAHAVVAASEPLPLPSASSAAALTTARDLLRASARGAAGLALELASFRLLFASGDPNEGARAFLEKREPEF